MTGRLRWWIIALVTFGTILNYLARSSLAVAAPTLKGVFDMSTQQYSWVVAAFQAAYTLMQPVAGYILDVLGARLGFALFAVGWSLSNCAHIFATGWPTLAVFRGFLGLTEAAAMPAGLKVVSEWFPPRERTIATGWFNIGSSLGGMLAPPIVIFCIFTWGWQSAFVVTGGVGLDESTALRRAASTARTRACQSSSRRPRGAGSSSSAVPLWRSSTCSALCTAR